MEKALETRAFSFLAALNALELRGSRLAAGSRLFRLDPLTSHYQIPAYLGLMRPMNHPSAP